VQYVKRLGTANPTVQNGSYDTAGNTETYSNLTYSYNDRGRMSSVTVGTTTSSYVYSALGQMIKKTVGSTSTLLMYDEAGHLLGEYSSTGALIQETVWMGDVPVATLRPNGSTGCASTICVFYVHTDQLNAPRKITQPSSNSLVWRWDTDPFGTAAPNQNPAGLGTFVYNLSFPGQYYQAETGLNYNYFRDYDPATGRYIESDPIGLAGGSWSTYAYADGNSISNIDASGQQAVAAGPIVVGGLVVGGICAAIPSCRDAAVNAAKAIQNSCNSEESADAREQRCQESLDRDPRRGVALATDARRAPVRSYPRRCSPCFPHPSRAAVVSRPSKVISRPTMTADVRGLSAKLARGERLDVIFARVAGVVFRCFIVV
jgi:RHS repeat-associated protein